MLGPPGRTAADDFRERHPEARAVLVENHDFAPRHHIGLAVGRVDAGWLLSPDFRPNDSLAEIRYQWQFRPKTSMEARVRQRRELEHPVGSRARVEDDVYLRLSHKF